MRRLAPIVLALLVPLFAVACGAAEEKGTGPEAVEGTSPQPTQTEGAETGGGGGGQAEGNAEAGATIYDTAGCGSCHAFEPAGSSGQAGPSLDDSEIDFEGAREQIANGGGGMPAFKDQLDEQEIADVAAFVTESRG